MTGKLAIGDVRVGTSGWAYPHWRGVLYPPGTGSRQLEVYAAEFDTVELNASFYHWPRAAAFENWRRRLPQDFVLTVKAPRGLTHAGALRNPQVWADRIGDGMRPLGGIAGPLLLQLPPDAERDDVRLDVALAAMPPGLPVAVELRHPSWVHDDVFALLERHDASYCVMSGARLPCELRATAELVYVRFHGPDPDTLYAGSYPDADLDWWAARITEWRAAHAVVAYFNNDGHGYAVHDARRLKARLGLSARAGQDGR
ncbi:DUF72 domain-containing protein [Microbacterium aureliae]